MDENERTIWRQKEAFQRRIEDALPIRIAPTGMFYERGLGGNGDSFACYRAILETDLGLMEILNHYAAEVPSKGWEPVSDTRDGALAWSVWKLQMGDEPWCGLIAVLRRPWTVRQYAITIALRYDGEDWQRRVNGWDTFFRSV